MTGRSYAQINCSLLRSKKLAELTDHKHNWAYISAHLTEFCTFNGMFRYPQVVWGVDSRLGAVELTEAICELCRVGLIEYDFDEEIVRITSWFHKKNCPDNASRMISGIRDYQACEIDHPEMYLRSLSEFVVGCIKRSRGWSQHSSDREKMREVFKSFLAQTWSDYEDDFLEELHIEVEKAGTPIRSELTSLFSPLDAYSQTKTRTPCPHPANTLSTHETKTKLDVDVTKNIAKTTTKTAQDFEIDQASSGGVEGGNGAVVRKEMRGSTVPPQKGPLAATKRSALAMGGA